MRAVFRMSDTAWLLVAVSSTLVIASIAHARVVNDWRAQGTMNLQVATKRTSVARNVRIGRK